MGPIDFIGDGPFTLKGETLYISNDMNEYEIMKQ